MKYLIVILVVLVLVIYLLYDLSKYLVLVILVLMLCNGKCFNGGIIFMFILIFGYCYCLCWNGFVGFRCEIFLKNRKLWMMYLLKKLRFRWLVIRI